MCTSRAGTEKLMMQERRGVMAPNEVIFEEVRSVTAKYKHKDCLHIDTWIVHLEKQGERQTVGCSRW